MSIEQGPFEGANGQVGRERVQSPERESREFVIQTPMQALRSWRDAASQANDRVWAQAMYFEEGHQSLVIARTLEKASERGVPDVDAKISWYGVKSMRGEVDPHPFANEETKTIRGVNRELRDRLEDHGVRTQVANNWGVLGDAAPIAAYFRANHNKSLGADNTAWFTKVNFLDWDFNRIDFALQVKNRAMVEALYEQIHARKLDLFPRKDKNIPVDQDSVLIVDGGMPGRSAIYDQAVDMVQTAGNHLVYIGRVLPDDGFCESIVARAKKGLPSTILTSSEASYQMLPKTFQNTRRRFLEATSGYPSVEVIHHPTTEVHTDFIVNDFEALFGTQNILAMERFAGTENTALRSRDRGLVGQFVQLADRIKQGASIQDLDHELSAGK